LVFFLVTVSSAQEKPDSIKRKSTITIPKYIVKFAPFSVLDPSYQSLQMAFEYRLHQRLSLQHEVGFIFGQSVFEEDITKAGVKIRNEVRFYPGTNNNLFYIAPEMLLIVARINNKSGTYWTNANPDQSVDFSYDISKVVYGNHFKIGLQPTTKKVVFDFYFGLGIRHKTVKLASQDPIPAGANVFYESNDEFNPDRFGKRYAPSMAAGFKIGYIIK
jgi:hypothetical protein